MTVNSSPVCRSDLNMDSRRSPTNSAGHGNASYLLHAPNISTHEPAESLLCFNACIKQLVAHAGLSAQGINSRSCPTNSVGHGNTSFLQYAQNVSRKELAESLICFNSCIRQLVSHVGLSAQGCRRFTICVLKRT
jgi:hypothetical protein